MSKLQNWLQQVAYPTKLYAEPITGGAMRFSGPRRFSTRGAVKLCGGSGLKFDVVLNPRTQQASLVAVALDKTVTPRVALPLLQTSGMDEIASYIKKHSKEGIEFSLSQVPLKLSGATTCYKMCPNAQIAIDGDVIANLLQAPNVLDIVITGASISFVLANPSSKVGGLMHISSTRRVKARVRRNVNFAGKPMRRQPRRSHV